LSVIADRNDKIKIIVMVDSQKILLCFCMYICKNWYQVAKRAENIAIPMVKKLAS
jgi:hypothetical protein